MRASWSIRRAVTTALLLSFAAVPLLGAVTYLRLYQLRRVAPRWAELAEASRLLSLSLICNGASDRALAEDDMERWQTALLPLTADHGTWLSDTILAERLQALQAEVQIGLTAESDTHLSFVTEHCTEARTLAGRSLEQVLHLALSPSSRADRYEDRGIRDVTVFLVVWIGLAVVLLLWVRRTVERPAQLIINTLERVADGDLDAKVPHTGGGEMSLLALALEHAVRRFDRRDHLKVQRIVEMRNLVERVLAFVEAPVIIIGLDGKVDYVNPLAAEAFGAPLDVLTGADLGHVPGGEALRQVVDQVLASGVGHEDHPLDLRGVFKVPSVARCALVRDGRGVPTRVIVMLEPDKGPWWQRLWEGAT